MMKVITAEQVVQTPQRPAMAQLMSRKMRMMREAQKRMISKLPMLTSRQPRRHSWEMQIWTS